MFLDRLRRIFSRPPEPEQFTAELRVADPFGTPREVQFALALSQTAGGLMDRVVEERMCDELARRIARTARALAAEFPVSAE